MPFASRFRLAAALLMTACTVAGCITPRSKPKLSQAVVEARAHRDAPTGPVCPQTPLGDLGAPMAGFAYGEATVAESPELTAAATWLACHPGVAVVIKPDADVHGTDAEQDALARRRGEAVRAYLVAHGVAAPTINLLPRGGAEPGGEHLLIRAEGRRW